jgi:hypothetical protein
LNAVVAEMTRQDNAAIVAAWAPRHDVDSARYQYCAGRLADVAKVVGARFRQ